jgi:hypothetical protein
MFLPRLSTAPSSLSTLFSLPSQRLSSRSPNLLQASRHSNVRKRLVAEKSLFRSATSLPGLARFSGSLVFLKQDLLTPGGPLSPTTPPPVPAPHKECKRTAPQLRSSTFLEQHIASDPSPASPPFSFRAAVRLQAPARPFLLHPARCLAPLPPSPCPITLAANQAPSNSPSLQTLTPSRIVFASPVRYAGAQPYGAGRPLKQIFNKTTILFFIQASCIFGSGPDMDIFLFKILAYILKLFLLYKSPLYFFLLQVIILLLSYVWQAVLLKKSSIIFISNNVIIDRDNCKRSCPA